MISKEKKAAIIAESVAEKQEIPVHQRFRSAILTARIAELTEHLKSNQKDHHFQTMVC